MGDESCALAPQGTIRKRQQGTTPRSARKRPVNLGKRRPPADPDRKARFREDARGIVFKDRDARRYGRSVDTACAITQAMERAWREGFAAAQDDDPPTPTDIATGDGPIPWHRIPPRPRSAFWTVCHWFLGNDDRHSDPGSVLIPAATLHGTFCWTLDRNFPPTALAAHGITAKHPDAFIRDLIEAAPEAAIEAFRIDRAGMAKPADGRRAVSGGTRTERIDRVCRHPARPQRSAVMPACRM